ncbi:MAG: ribonuclease HII [Spirochaetes bacterium]|nr:ribonuclease HII [Spirochaetota bacterium]
MITGTKKNGTNKKAGIENPAFSAYPSFNLELALMKKGYRLIAGIDEAGRGALAGPLSVGIALFSDLFIRKPDREIFLVNDSKKLSHKKRLIAEEIIKKHSLYCGFEFIDNDIIDETNINRATEMAVNSLLGRLPVKPDFIMIDGKFNFNLGIPCRPVVKGDSISISIASASIMAKTGRDRVMVEKDGQYPEYGFSSNKGYGTKRHIDAIMRTGITPLHRKSYEPVKSILFPE